MPNKVKLPIEVYGAFFRQALGAAAAQKRALLARESEARRAELLALYRLELFHLRLQRACREELHACAQLKSQAHLWSLAQRQKACAVADAELRPQALQRIRAALRAQPAFAGFRSALAAALGAKLSTAKKLQNYFYTRVLADLQLLAHDEQALRPVVGRRLAPLPPQRARGELLAHFRDGAQRAAKVEELLASFNAVLQHFEHPARYWTNFWADVSESVDASLCARSLQILWLHQFHPFALAPAPVDAAALLARARGAPDWKALSAEFRRTPLALFRLFLQLTQAARTDWSAQEDKLLLETFEARAPPPRGEGATPPAVLCELEALLPARCEKEIRQRLTLLLRKRKLQRLVKGSWRISEDVRLVMGVLLFGEGNWREIIRSGLVTGRTPQQMRERFVKALKPQPSHA